MVADLTRESTAGEILAFVELCREMAVPFVNLPGAVFRHVVETLATAGKLAPDSVHFTWCFVRGVKFRLVPTTPEGEVV